ncbi:hypothetical protein, partial [Pectobacterium zantedeschiae]|uniref:hypothetical protein n=1 Tax=Pectobacterium zantedeschiae TaxID=2034769 RepID=UPI001A9295C0
DSNSPSNTIRLFAASGSPFQGQRDKRTAQRLRRLSESGTTFPFLGRLIRTYKDCPSLTDIFIVLMRSDARYGSTVFIQRFKK